MDDAILRAVIQALEKCLREERDLERALARFLGDQSNPLALALNASDCLFLAEHLLSRARAQADAVRALVRDEKQTLQRYLGDPDSPAAQVRRKRLQHLDFSAAHLPQDVMQTLYDALKEGVAPAQTLYAAGEQLKAALAALNYLLLRSGLLPEENDDVHADALIAGVCAAVDIAAALSAVRENQTTFVSTQKLLRCACVAFLICACEDASTAELPDELISEMTDLTLLRRALLLAGGQLPQQLQLTAESEALREKLGVRLASAQTVQRAVEKLRMKEKTPEQTGKTVSAPVVWVDEPERPD